MSTALRYSVRSTAEGRALWVAKVARRARLKVTDYPAQAARYANRETAQRWVDHFGADRFEVVESPSECSCQCERCWTPRPICRCADGPVGEASSSCVAHGETVSA